MLVSFLCVLWLLASRFDRGGNQIANLPRDGSVFLGRRALDRFSKIGG
jgi:hypothetical protein